ncbi:Bet1-like SNARE 1-2 [Glycine soja]
MRPLKLPSKLSEKKYDLFTTYEPNHLTHRFLSRISNKNTFSTFSHKILHIIAKICVSPETRFASHELPKGNAGSGFWNEYCFEMHVHCSLAVQDNRSSRSSLVDGFDSLEEGGLRASSSYSREINEHDNDKAIENLQDRVSFLKREFLVLTNVKVHGKVLLVFKVLPAMVLLLFKLTGDIHEEVESHNQLLDRVGNKMDGSRGVMMGTMDRFKKVFEKKSARKTCSLVGYFTLAFIFIYYLIRMLGYFTLG